MLGVLLLRIFCQISKPAVSNPNARLKGILSSMHCFELKAFIPILLNPFISPWAKAFFAPYTSLSAFSSQCMATVIFFLPLATSHVVI